MKSEKAKTYIEDRFISEYNDIEHYLYFFGEHGEVLEKDRIGRCRRYADKAVEMAEQEVERCYENIVADLTMAQIKNVRELSRKFDEALDVRLKIERDKAKDAFCNGCESLIPARCPCVAFDRFIEKLNAN